MSGDLKPGDVTTLGQLRPGDVGEWLESDRRFIVQGVPASGRSLVHYDRGSEAPYMAHHPVRYLGRGRIEPARIVMEGEPDRVAVLEAAIRHEIAELERRSDGATHWDGCHESHPMCAAIRRLRAALDATDLKIPAK